MAKKISKTWKRVLSILFHVLVLIGFIVLYDSGQAIYDKFVPKGSDSEKASEGGDAEAKGEKEQGTTFADMLEQRQQKKKAAEKNAVEEGLKVEGPEEESPEVEGLKVEDPEEESSDTQQGE